MDKLTPQSESVHVMTSDVEQWASSLAKDDAYVAVDDLVRLLDKFRDGTPADCTSLR